MNIEAYTVSDINQNIKSLLESEFSNVTLIGEISNLSHSSAGHYYFTLSDENSAISCAIFKMDALRNPTLKKLKDGDKVFIRGGISLYSKRGTFQLIGRKIIPAGKGDLKAKFEFLKEKLASEGLFDASEKKEIPKLAKRIAVLTALRGAALQDFLNVMKRRCLEFEIIIVPCVVQGDDCPRSVISGLEKVLAIELVDVVVITRGGGSMEDLWGFNDESLVRFVSEYPLPVISAIGHQVDYSLLDYVSDLRCETPSTAAEFLSQEQTKLKLKIDNIMNRLKFQFTDFHSRLRSKLNRVSPKNFIHLIQEKFYTKKMKFESLDSRLKKDYFNLEDVKMELDENIKNIETVINSKIDSFKNKLNLQEKLLSSIDPKNVLNRGYSYITDENSDVIETTKSFLNSTSEVHFINFKDGREKIKKIKDNSKLKE